MSATDDRFTPRAAHDPDGFSDSEARFDAWHQALKKTCGQFEAERQQHSFFKGHVHEIDWGGLPVSRIMTNAQRVVCHGIRQTGSSDVADDTHCFLVVQHAGYARMQQMGWSFEMAPGDMVFMDAAYGCEIVPHGLMEHVSIHLDRALVGGLIAQNGSRMAKLSRQSSCGRMLHMVAGQICVETANQTIDPEDGEALQNTLITLLRQVLKQPLDAALHVSDAGLDARLLRQAKEAIDAALQDPRLSPQSLAQTLHISVRQLYRLFEQENDSVCRYIQRARLAQAARDLQNPYLGEKSLTEIAYAWGFSDSAHFSRSFKKQFDLSPRDYRRQLREPGQASLAH